MNYSVKIVLYVYVFNLDNCIVMFNIDWPWLLRKAKLVMKEIG